MGFRYVYIVGEIFLAGIFLVALYAGVRSWLWKAVWVAAAGSLWYFAGVFFAAPLMIAVILQIATNVASSVRSLPAKNEVSTGA
jgi:hypothetical protein